jgi:hypothetical protein
MDRAMPEPYRNFPCTHCGAQCQCPERLVRDYPGQTVTRWCDTCRHLYNVTMPPRDPTDRLHT